jgi:hypothetical protein
MSDLKQAFQSQMEAAGVPTNQAAAAADALAKQQQKELPCPLPEGSEELQAVRSAYTWFCAKQRTQ